MAEGQCFPPDEVPAWTDAREHCGFVVQDSDLLTWLYEVPNISTKPGDYFEISADEFLKYVEAQERGAFTLVGVWHSHPKGKPVPSATDWAYHPSWLFMFIVCDGKVRCYTNKKEVPVSWESEHSLT